MFLGKILKLKRTVNNHSDCTYTEHKCHWSFKDTNSPTINMVNWQTCLGGTMTFDIRKVTGIRIVGTGAAKCSTYQMIDKSWNSPNLSVNSNLGYGEW